MMKILSTIFLIIICLNVSAQSFGPDKTGYADTTYNVRKSIVSVAFNGWIYVAFNYKVVGSGFTGRLIEVSKDNGLTWQTLLDNQFNPQNVIAFTSMIVAGTDTTNLRIFATSTSHFNQYQSGFLSVFDGLTGNTITPFVTLADGNNFGIRDMAICSDSKHPQSTSIPFSVVVTYSQYDSSSFDSILVIYSNDGGINFTGPYVVSSGPQISKVATAYGSNSITGSGRFSFVWEQNGNIGARQADAGIIPMNFYSSLLLDTTYMNFRGILHNPSLASQSADYNNLSGSYSTIVLAERYDSTTATNDIVGFFNSDTLNGGFGSPFLLDTSAQNTIDPKVAFDETNGNFIATWYNQTYKELPCFFHSINFTGSWTSLTYNYADTSSFLSPNISLSTDPMTNEIIVCWVQETDTTDLLNSRGILKYDATTLPLFISHQKSEGDFKVSPSLSNGKFNVFIKKEFLESPSQLEIYNSLSYKVYSEKIQNSNSDFNNCYNLDLGMGTYFLTLRSEKRILTQKIIIQ